MKHVQQIHYRYLTDADFFNLNKPSGTEDKGGGQTYLDFPVRKIALESWNHFFDQIDDVKTQEVAQGIAWDLPIRSVGLPLLSEVQRVKIYQRRSASISVAAQSLNRRGSNRIHGWHPNNGFPQPVNPTDRHGTAPDGLCVYLVSTAEGEVWAGWFQRASADLGADEGATRLIEPMVSRENTAGSSGLIAIQDASLLLRENDLQKPFAVLIENAGVTGRAPIAKEPITPPATAPTFITRDEQEIINSLFQEDEDPSGNRPETRERIQQIRVRNLKAVKDLKELYQNQCQVSGDRFSFRKRNGEIYSEVHHLIPLGDGGADDPRNMIVVNPLIHRMLHYAEVIGLDLSEIQVDEEGESTLEIRINGEPYTITWCRDHARRILASE